MTLAVDWSIYHRTYCGIRAADGRPTNQNEKHQCQHGNSSTGGIAALQCCRSLKTHLLVEGVVFWNEGQPGGSNNRVANSQLAI